MEPSWINIATFDEAAAAGAAGGLLSAVNIPNSLVYPPHSDTSYLYVPPHVVERTKALLNAPPPPERELIFLATGERVAGEASSPSEVNHRQPKTSLAHQEPPLAAKPVGRIPDAPSGRRDVKGSTVWKRQRALLLVHVACSVIAGFILIALEQDPVNNFSSGRLSGGTQGLNAALPAMIPFIVSYFVSRGRVVYGPLALVTFCCIVLASMAVGSWLLYQADDDSRFSTLLWTTGAQILIFAYSAILIGRLAERPHHGPPAKRSDGPHR
jgi:hypothetical protein